MIAGWDMHHQQRLARSAREMRLQGLVYYYCCYYYYWVQQQQVLHHEENRHQSLC